MNNINTLNDLYTYLYKNYDIKVFDYIKSVTETLLYIDYNSYIIDNITKENLDELAYKKIVNKIPAKIIEFITKHFHHFHISPDAVTDLMRIKLQTYHFSMSNIDKDLLNEIQTIIADIRNRNISWLKFKYPDLNKLDKDKIMEILKPIIKQYILSHKDYIHELFINEHIYDLNQLNKYIQKYPKRFANNFVFDIINKDTCTLIFQKLNIKCPMRNKIYTHILSLINFSELFYTILVENFNEDEIFPTNIYDLYEFYLLKDKINDIQYSTRSPYDFSEDRTSPIIVINDYVGTKQDEYDHHFELIEHYKEKHKRDKDKICFNTFDKNDEVDDLPEDITETAAGSVFNKVVLLEYIQGDREKINKTLLNHGYKKVYINNNSETDKQYKRIAKKLFIKMK